MKQELIMSRRKLLIIDKGVKKTGKSTAVKEVIRMLIDVYKLHPEPIYETDNFEKTDVACVFILNGVKIGIESCGDPGPRLPKTLKIFREKECDIILCASRTKGEIMNAIKSKKDKYTLLYAPHYFEEGNSDSAFVTSLNARYARNIVEIMMEWIARNKE